MVRDTIWSRTRIVGITLVNLHAAEDQHVGEWRDTRAPTGLTETTGRRGLARVPLSWADVDTRAFGRQTGFQAILLASLRQLVQ